MNILEQYDSTTKLSGSSFSGQPSHHCVSQYQPQNLAKSIFDSWEVLLMSLSYYERDVLETKIQFLPIGRNPCNTVLLVGRKGIPTCLNPLMSTASCCRLHSPCLTKIHILTHLYTHAHNQSKSQKMPSVTSPSKLLGTDKLKCLWRTV